MPVAVSWDGEGQAAAGYLATLSSQEACFCHRQSRAAGWQAKYPSSRAGLQPSCSTPGLCCLRASLSNLTALSVLGQDTNSWSSIMRLPPVCPACLLGRACGLLRAKKERGGSQGAGSFLAIPVGTPLLAPAPSPEPHTLTVAITPPLMAHPTRSELSGKDTEWSERQLQQKRCLKDCPWPPGPPVLPLGSQVTGERDAKDTDAPRELPHRKACVYCLWKGSSCRLMPSALGSPTSTSQGWPDSSPR